MPLAIGGLLTAFAPSEFMVPAAILLLVGRGGGRIDPSLLDGRGGGRIDPSLLGGLIELVPDVLPYMDCGRGLMLGFLLSVDSDVLLLGACILEPVGLCIFVGDASPATAALLNLGAGAAAAALVSMLNPFLVLERMPLSEPESTAGFLIERVRDGIDVVDMVLWLSMQANTPNAPKDAVDRAVARLALLTGAAALSHFHSASGTIGTGARIIFSRSAGVLGVNAREKLRHGTS